MVSGPDYLRAAELIKQLLLGGEAGAEAETKHGERQGAPDPTPRAVAARGPTENRGVPHQVPQADAFMDLSLLALVGSLAGSIR